MPEREPTIEPGPSFPGIDAFEALVTKGEWNARVEAELNALLEKHTLELYDLYLNYKESGLVDELPEHERRMYERLDGEFGE